MMFTHRSLKIDLPRRQSHRNVAPLIILPLAAATVGTYIYVINRTKVKHDASLDEWRNRTADLTPSWDKSKSTGEHGGESHRGSADIAAGLGLGQEVSPPMEDISKVEPLYDSGDKDMLDRRPSDTNAPVSRDMPGDKAYNPNAPVSDGHEDHEAHESAEAHIGPEATMAEAMEHEIEAVHETAAENDPSNFGTLIGKSVVDINGDHVGDVEAVYYRNLRMEPEWVAVTTGLIDRNRVLVPLDGHTDGEKIEVPYPKDMIEKAPAIEARVLDEDVEMPLYAFYSTRRILPGVESERHPEAVKLRSWSPPDPDRKEWAPS